MVGKQGSGTDHWRGFVLMARNFGALAAGDSEVYSGLFAEGLRLKGGY